MWSVITILRSELDPTTSVESQPIKASNAPVWTCPISLDGYELGTNALILEVVLSSSLGRVFVTSASVPVGRLIYIHEIMDQSPSTDRQYETASPVLNVLRVNEHIEFSYVAYKYREIIEGKVTMLGQIRISVVSVGFDVMSLINRNGHKLTCLVNETYLGRPQECLTRGDFRTYYWKSQARAPPESIRARGKITPRGTYVAPEEGPFLTSPRKTSDFDLIVEYNSDMSLIRMATPAGMKKHVTLTNYVPDNDAYSNPHTLLPIFMTDAPLCFKFFNFGFVPPKCVETTIKWKDIIATRPICIRQEAIVEKRAILRRKTFKLPDQQMYMFSREIVPGMKLLMHYHVVEENVKLKITSVYVHVDAYDVTLQMDRMQERVTV